MRSEEFKAWLFSRGISPSSVRTRDYAVRKIESVLRELGCPHDDLDAAFAADSFAQLCSVLDDLRKDAEAGGEGFRILMPDSKVPVGRLHGFKSWLRQYGQFLRGEDATIKRTNWVELEELRDRFLDRAADFVDFAQTEGAYFETERAYKETIREAVLDAVSSENDVVELGRQVALALIPSEGPILRWQTFDTIAKHHPEFADEFFGVIGELARSRGPVEDAIWSAVSRMEDLRSQKVTPLRVGEILSICLSVAGFVHPEASTPFKISFARKLAEKLTGNRIFGSKECDRTEITQWLDLLHRVFKVMRDDWEWRPKDLIDVQGFAWVALSDDWGGDEADFGEPIILYDARGVEYIPVSQKNTATGVDAFRIKPPGASNKAEDAVEETDVIAVASAILIDRLPVRIRQVDGGTPNYLTYGGSKLVWYRLSQDLADALGLPETNLPDQYQPENAHQSQSGIMTEPTNLILYGPPGTGKTYTTAREAVRLCDGNVPDREEETFARYRQLVDAGQIEFVTFHQTYAYEDFVEGLRPAIGEKGEANGFSLEPREGIFRKISALADQARKSGGKSGRVDISDRQIFKMSLGQAGAEEHIYDAAINSGYAVLGWGGLHDWSDPRFSEKDEIAARWQELGDEITGGTGAISQLWNFRSVMREGDIIIVSEGNGYFRAIGEVTGPYSFSASADGEYNHRRPVNWLAVFDEALPVDTIYGKSFQMQSCYQMKDALLKKEALARLMPGEQSETDAPDQFVLIIDEINRANISKVFGELITLLEPDKRLGQPRELKVTLPYSGDPFGVPSNLHIVGTMNTADRSIALLDTALRRRFEFRELMPDPDLLEVASEATGVDLVNLLTTMNARIEYLFDRDHQIGHAYFINCHSLEDVNAVMRHKVIPLLAEYFYEDWQKVALVLGDAEGQRHFISRVELPAPSSNSDDLEEPRWRWEINDTFSPASYQEF